MVSEWENFCFIVEVLDVCVCSAACDDSEMMDDQRVLPYSMMGRVIAL